MHRGYANPQKEIQRLARICDRFRDENNALRADLEAVAGALLRSVCLNVALRRGQRGAVDKPGLEILLGAKEILKGGEEALDRPGVRAVLDQATSRATATSTDME